MLKNHLCILSSALLILVVACTVSNPKYCPNKMCSDAGTNPVDGAKPVDGTMPDPKTTIRVSPGGNDAADGLAAPVKTLKRAISIASSNGAIKTIHLEPGKYTSAGEESYPYTVPKEVTVLGDPGTILIGTNSEEGLIVDSSSLVNLEFNDFLTAIHSVGNATANNIVVRTSSVGGVGILADGSAKVTGKDLKFTGDSMCTTAGVRAIGNSEVTIDTFSSADMMSVDLRDQAVVSIRKGTIASKTSGCNPLVKASGKSLTLVETVVSGGSEGIHQYGNGRLEITLRNTTIADTMNYAIVGEGHVLSMIGGEIRSTSGVTLLGGTSTFTNVSITGSPVHGILVNEGPEPARLKVRGCTITGLHAGVMVSTGTTDLGTAADPGNNTIRGNPFSNLTIGAGEVLSVTAVGNTWNANVQGTNSDGHASHLVVGPVSQQNGNNFTIFNSSTIQL